MARTSMGNVKGNGLEKLDAALAHFVARLPVSDLKNYAALPQTRARSQGLLMRWLDRFVEPVGDLGVSRQSVQAGLKQPKTAYWTQPSKGSRLLVLPAGSVVRDPVTKSYGILKRPVAGRPERDGNVLTVQTRGPLHQLTWGFLNPLPEGIH